MKGPDPTKASQQSALVPPKNNLSFNRLLSERLPTKGEGSLVHEKAVDLDEAQGALLAD